VPRSTTAWRSPSTGSGSDPVKRAQGLQAGEAVAEEQLGAFDRDADDLARVYANRERNSWATVVEIDRWHSWGELGRD
jgi:hypothetical protein